MILNLVIYLNLLLSCAFPVTAVKTSPGFRKPGEEKHKKEIKIFESDRLLKVTLKLDLKAYLKKEFKEALDATLIIYNGENDSTSMDVKVNNRGTYRSSSCNYPPLEITFRKPVQAYTGFGKIHKMKLYTSCETGEIYNEYVLREFLVYKFFNVLSDSSYRVRLLKLSMEDSNGKRKSLNQYGFFLEPKEILAERLDARIMESIKPVQSQIVPESLDRLGIFNYMVSNYDWSVQSQHNVTVLLPLRSNPSGFYIVVPHDFDGTGVVNALYSSAGSGSGMKSIRERTFLGYCRTDNEFRTRLRYILAKKKEIYSVINDFQYINLSSKKDITDFLDQFFNQVARQSGLENLIRNFQEKCLK